MKRPTIADIARRAGVTKSTVSFALNGRPGVSEATRRRILLIARRWGWQPSRAARALSGGRADVLGLVVDRPARTLGIEPFFMQLISGIEGELATATSRCCCRSPGHRRAERHYRRWWAERRVDGVFLVDLRVDDERTGLLAELGMPAVVVGGPGGWRGCRAVERRSRAVRSVVEYLAALGPPPDRPRAGLPELWHTAVRAGRSRTRRAELGVVGRRCDHRLHRRGGRAGHAAAAHSAEPPTAIVYDNDVMAVAGLSVAAEMGVPVPGRLSIVAWDDSVLCRLVHPPLTAVSLDIPAYGAAGGPPAARPGRRRSAGERLPRDADARAAGQHGRAGACLR